MSAGSALREPSPTRPSSRAHSRASSRASVRSVGAGSPSVSSEDPVSIRNQMSSIKHTIRHQQAQLQSLETMLHRSPRPLSASLSRIPSNPALIDGFSPLERAQAQMSPVPGTPTPQSTKKQRRTSSFEILSSMAGPDSLLPLPRKDGPNPSANGIREGVPADFSTPLNSSMARRTSSPTRTLSRIPVASVGHARALAEDGQSPRPTNGTTNGVDLNGSPSLPTDSHLSSPSALHLPPSPSGRRLTFGGGGNTTKVLADLQAGVINAKNALENTKAQLRLSQRTVAQLTRQTEDLKDGRERLRLENEGLNNVVARKERLLQEVLERARKAEAEASALKTQLKSETTASKKSIREMEAQVSHCTAVSQKSEREYITLRDAIKHLSDGWKQDVERLKREMHERETKWKKEAEDVGFKYRRLLSQVEKERALQTSVKELKAEDERVKKEWEDTLTKQIKELRMGIQRTESETSAAGKTAQDVANELSRLRSLIRAVSSTPAGVDEEA